LGQGDAARQCLETGRKLMDLGRPTAPDQPAKFSAPADWIMANVLLRESEAVLQSEPKTESLAAQPVENPSAPRNETPDGWVTRIEEKLGRAPRNTLVNEYEKEKSAFLERYPDDPSRWRLSILDAKLALTSSDNRSQSIKDAKASLAKLNSATDT